VTVPQWANAQSTSPQTLVSTIDGFYGGPNYDTPWLTISNTTGFSFTNVQMTLTGYQGLNNGVVSLTMNLGTIGAGTTQTDVWGSLPGVSSSTTPGVLTAFDYDDEYASNSNPANAGCTINDNQYSQVQYYFCAPVGNFYVTLTGTWNNPAYAGGSTSIYSQFSPGQDPFNIGNACGNTPACYIAWEGLDPTGLSETVYDDHSTGGPNGVLANIYVGSPPEVSATPEPGTMLLFVPALGFLGLLRRKRA
jgi:hypothetical protein